MLKFDFPDAPIESEKLYGTGDVAFFLGMSKTTFHRRLRKDDLGPNLPKRIQVATGYRVFTGHDIFLMRDFLTRIDVNEAA